MTTIDQPTKASSKTTGPKPRTKAIAPEVMEVLQRCVVEGNAVRLPPEQLDRKLYTATNEALEAIGGRWSKKEKAHLFESDPSDALDRVLGDGAFARAPKDAFEFFPTPEPLAERVADLLRLQPGDLVLEPSAGDGALVRAVKRACQDLRVMTCEIDERHHAKLRGWGVSVVAGDFLQVEDMEERPRRIAMNPPFSRQQDVDHVMHAWGLLAPGGRLVAIVSAGVTFRENEKTSAFRALVEEHGTIEELPEGSFKPSGTGVNTALVTLDKPADWQAERQAGKPVAASRRPPRARATKSKEQAPPAPASPADGVEAAIAVAERNVLRVVAKFNEASCEIVALELDCDEVDAIVLVEGLVASGWLRKGHVSGAGTVFFARTDRRGAPDFEEKIATKWVTAAQPEAEEPPPDPAALLLKAIGELGPLSLDALSRRTGLSPEVATAAMSIMVEDGRAHERQTEIQGRKRYGAGPGPRKPTPVVAPAEQPETIPAPPPDDEPATSPPKFSAQARTKPLFADVEPAPEPDAVDAQHTLDLAVVRAIEESERGELSGLGLFNEVGLDRNVKHITDRLGARGILSMHEDGPETFYRVVGTPRERLLRALAAGPQTLTTAARAAVIGEDVAGELLLAARVGSIVVRQVVVGVELWSLAPVEDRALDALQAPATTHEVAQATGETVPATAKAIKKLARKGKVAEAAPTAEGERTYKATAPDDVDTLAAWLDTPAGHAAVPHRLAPAAARAVVALLTPEQRSLAWLAAHRAEIKAMLLAAGRTEATAATYAGNVGKAARAKLAGAGELTTEEQIREALTAVARWPALAPFVGPAVAEAREALGVGEGKPLAKRR